MSTGKPVAIRCSCGTLFGYSDEANERLVIKHRDLYRMIYGEVKGPCRKCGNDVSWSPTKHIKGGDAA
jgi:hypothetical protein